MSDTREGAEPQGLSGAEPSVSELPGPEVRMASMVFPQHTNHYGTLFGGEAMRLMDEAAFLAASRWTRCAVVTVASERVEFRVPIHRGELVETVARVVAAGRTSVTVEVELIAEDLRSGERRHATSGRFTLVAVDADGRPTREWGTRATDPSSG